MKYAITIVMDTTRAIYEQIKRNGCEIVREGEAHVVRVPNRVLNHRMYQVEISQSDQPVCNDVTSQETQNAEI